jgi:hypothetical protein
MADKPSKAAIDLIVESEVTSKGYYEKHYRKPEWPGGASGVTIAVGYDLGFANEAKLRNDWTGKIDDDMIDALIKYAGLTGEKAHAKLAEAREEIDIPWEAAYDVFENIDMPDWSAKVKKALPNTDKLSEDSFGALVSLAYNRGASFSKDGDRYKEMREIKENMANETFDQIPDCFREMKRLWPNVRGLQDRRDAEAKLFEAGLENA